MWPTTTAFTLYRRLTTQTDREDSATEELIIRQYDKSKRAAAMVVFIACVLALGLLCQGGCWRTALMKEEDAEFAGVLDREGCPNKRSF